MNSIFLSHNSADKVFVQRLVRDLSKAGIKCWVDEAEIKVGDSLIDKIEKGIKNSKYLAVVLTPSSVKSEWVRRELELALNNEIARRKLKVLPLLLADCEIPGFLKGKAYADFRETYNKGLASLLSSLIPKRAFDIGMGPANDSHDAVVLFKDDMDQPVLLKRLPLTTTIAEIRKMKPQHIGSLWVNISFNDIKLLEHVELFCYEKTRGIRLSFSLDIGELVPHEISGSKAWQEIAERIEIEVWNKDTEIMAVLNCQEIAVNWGGPDAVHVKASTEISFYIDNDISWFIVERNFKYRNAIDNETLEGIHFTSTNLSYIVQGVIEELRAKRNKIK